jgi:DNA polymerase/3'-5' exonuclease PolX
MKNKIKIDEVLIHLRMLATFYSEYDEDYHRGNSFYKAIESLEESGIKKIADVDAVKELPGIGPSTLKEITEFIATRTSTRLEEILSQSASFKQRMKEDVLKNYTKFPELVAIWQDK